MGGFFARYYHFHDTNLNRRDRIETPKATPKRKIMLDPRSPTSEISRTPIQVEVMPRQTNAEKVPLPALAVPSGADDTRNVTEIKHKSLSTLQLERNRDPRSPSYGIVRTPLQVAAEGEERDDNQAVEQVQDILLYEGRAEVPLVRNSPGQAAHPSCARIMGLPPQGGVGTDPGQRLDADIGVFLSGLSKALSLTETQQQKVLRTYHGQENCVRTKRLQLPRQKGSGDAPPPRARVPLSDVNSPHQMWQGRSVKDRHGLSVLSENTPPGMMHDASKLHAVWDQDATVII